MIPIQLVLEGLYSYRDRQHIDFKQLTEAGLFGIFGAVGSGKSSILEAISFALYGETERLHGRDNRAYNMMNLKSKRAYISFDFTNYENKIFRATREFKRNSKNFEDVKTAVVFYEWKNGEWIALESTRADEIIGLSYANFKRTIIIPQGQFKEFLELGAKDRTTMMKEIFNLQKFDLHQNATVLHNLNKSKLDQLEGQLKSFESIGEEIINEKKELLNADRAMLINLQLQLEITEKKVQQQKNLKSDFDLLNEKETIFRNLSSRKPNVDTLEQTTALYTKTYNDFNHLLNSRKKLASELEENRRIKEAKKIEVEKLKHEFTAIQEKLKVILPEYEQLETSKYKENDLRLLIELNHFSDHQDFTKERSLKGFEEVSNVKEQEKQLQEKMAVLSANLEVLKKDRIDGELLQTVSAWYSQNKLLQEAEIAQQKKLSEIEKKIQETLKTLPASKTFRDDFKKKIQVLEEQLNALNHQKNHLLVQQKLAHFADELHDGQNCPLCGSTEHPNIVQFDNVSEILHEVDGQSEIISKEKENLRHQISEFEKTEERLVFFGDQKETEEIALTEIQKKIEIHVKSFIWTDFHPVDEDVFNEKKLQAFALQKEIEKINQSQVENQKRLDQLRKNFEKYNIILQNVKLEEKETETKIKSHTSSLKILKLEDFKDEKTPELEALWNDLHKKNKFTEKTYADLTGQEKALSPLVAEGLAVYSQLKKRIAEIEQEVINTETELQKHLADNHFPDLDAVIKILHQNTDVEKNRKIIEDFRIQFKVVEEIILNLKAKLQGFSFDEDALQKMLSQFAREQEQVSTANNAVVKLSAEIERLEGEFIKKEALIKEYELLQKRSENLKAILNLLKGAGFVQYVSSIYLRQLCDHANVRFHRMTRNQLSLQLNENNDFEIIDYLNEGRCRSVKTLSGGQAFQVSLSLALALAESVQANAKADKNFFFIDEGFGTQDADSVNIVFETLQNLQKENRIVGIISHVEELKEKIPRSLSIIKDEERGSLVTVN